MMIAMMAPAVTPWLRAYDRLAGDAWGGTWRFAAGYFTVWLGYSIVAATLQSGLARVGGASLSASSLTGGGVLLVAGLFQFTPMKAACLTHCRNPLSYLVASWHGGPPSAFGLGIRHGAYCVGCCWLLMITGFAVGLMHLGWMAMVTLVVTAEQTLPGGAWVGRLFGAVLVAWGGMLLAGA
jgi:predicted metal-binding membrane protein